MDKRAGLKDRGQGSEPVFLHGALLFTNRVIATTLSHTESLISKLEILLNPLKLKLV
jgi:hypothetical protein